eukprot:5196191-Pyramimonas_sp.AAC.1
MKQGDDLKAALNTLQATDEEEWKMATDEDGGRSEELTGRRRRLGGMKMRKRKKRRKRRTGRAARNRNSGNLTSRTHVETDVRRRQESHPGPVLSGDL